MTEKQFTAVVAEDDPDVRTIITGLLEGAGWHVVAVEDGERAVLEVLECAPDLVILDVMMPGGDGTNALKALREDVRTEHIPVIMLTAVNDYVLGRQQNAESLGAQLGVRPPERFLEKPVDQHMLLREITAVLER